MKLELAKQLLRDHTMLIQALESLKFAQQKEYALTQQISAIKKINEQLQVFITENS